MMYRDPYMNEWENTIEDARRKENEPFELTAPEGEDGDEDSLGEQTTNDSIDIEIVEDAAAVDFFPFDAGIDYVGYEPYEPSPYDGTYSEM